MKSLISWKMPVLLAGIGAALLLTPACKAQEVNPDHFDGRDFWATARTAKPKTNKPAANASLQAQAPKKSQGSSLQLASARETTKPAQRDAVAADRKRKPAVGNPKK